MYFGETVKASSSRIGELLGALCRNNSHIRSKGSYRSLFGRDPEGPCHSFCEITGDPYGAYRFLTSLLDSLRMLGHPKWE